MLSAKLLKLTAKGFTLIELLVVIGILGALTIMALVALNPAEAQRKSRDVQRLKDLATIQSVIEQYLQDNTGTTITFVATAILSTATASPSSCSTGWLSTAIKKSGVDANFCTYANVIPIDPVNRPASVVSTELVTESATAAYSIQFLSATNGAYKLCTRLESKSNAAKLTSDGEALNSTVGSKASKNFAIYTDNTTDTAILCP